MIDEPAMKRAREFAAANTSSHPHAEHYREGQYDNHPAMIALAKHLHEVSDAVAEVVAVLRKSPDGNVNWMADCLCPFILPKPKPDPMTAIIAELRKVDPSISEWYEALPIAMAKAGYEFKEIEP